MFYLDAGYSAIICVCVRVCENMKYCQYCENVISLEYPFLIRQPYADLTLVSLLVGHNWTKPCMSEKIVFHIFDTVSIDINNIGATSTVGFNTRVGA